jgi:hypothetical protein
MGQARAGQVVVTRTVRDLATGTDLMFASLGSVNLRGVPGEWDSFASPSEGDARAEPQVSDVLPGPSPVGRDRGGYHEIVGLLGVRSHTSKKVSRFWPDTFS